MSSDILHEFTQGEYIVKVDGIADSDLLSGGYKAQLWYNNRYQVEIFVNFENGVACLKHPLFKASAKGMGLLGVLIQGLSTLPYPTPNKFDDAVSQSDRKYFSNELPIGFEE